YIKDGVPEFSEKYKEKDLAGYKKRVLGSAFRILDPIAGSRYFHCVSRMQMDQQMVGMSQYIVRTRPSSETRGGLIPSDVIVLHQDNFLIQRTLTRVS